MRRVQVGKIATGSQMIRKSCSVVIRAYNEEKHIGRLLTGIAEQSIRELEVILVDSGSTDKTVQIATDPKWNFPVKVVHIEPEDFSFGRSLNYGISAASTEHIVIASAHVYPVYSDWIEKLIAPLSEPGIALAYGKQRGNSLTKYSESQIFARWYPDQSQQKRTNPFCNNAKAAIKRSLWEKHPYDESLSGLEDLEWGHWAIENGFALAYVAEAEVIHIHQDTPSGVYNRYRREAMAFKKIFPHETFSIWDFFRLLGANILSDLWHASREKKLIDSFSSIFWFRLMQFLGTYRGYRQAGPLTWELRRTFYYPHSIRGETLKTKRGLNPIKYNDGM